MGIDYQLLELPILETVVIPGAISLFTHTSPFSVLIQVSGIAVDLVLSCWQGFCALVVSVF